MHIFTAWLACHPQQPIEPVEPAEPVEPTEPTEPAEPAEPAPARGSSVPPEATGVLVLDEGGSARVVFPAGEVPGFDPRPEADPADPYRARVAVRVPVGELVVFDAEGELGRLPPIELGERFWCENDGGIQFRLEAALPEAPHTARPLRPLERGDGIVAFVRPSAAGPALPDAPPDPERTVRLLGDLDADGRPDASLIGRPDEATCEDGYLDLVTARGTAPLRCCGP